VDDDLVLGPRARRAIPGRLVGDAPPA